MHMIVKKSNIFVSEIVNIFLNINLNMTVFNMTYVPKRTVSLRRFFWEPRT